MLFTQGRRDDMTAQLACKLSAEDGTLISPNRQGGWATFLTNINLIDSLNDQCKTNLYRLYMIIGSGGAPFNSNLCFQKLQKKNFKNWILLANLDFNI